jgi:hypothetical protein
MPKSRRRDHEGDIQPDHETKPSVIRQCVTFVINQRVRQQAARSGLKLGCGCPPMSSLFGSLGRQLVGHRELRSWALQCCLEHAS